MDPLTPRRDDDLSDIERRLAGWQPACESLDTDAMLFAAGRAAGRRGRGPVLWPAFCVLLAIQAAGLGLWGLSERAGRLALAGHQPERALAPSAPPSSAVAVVPMRSPPPSPDGYLNLRRQMEQDPSRWLASREIVAPRVLRPPPSPAILRASEYEALLNQ